MFQKTSVVLNSNRGGGYLKTMTKVHKSLKKFGDLLCSDGVALGIVFCADLLEKTDVSCPQFELKAIILRGFNCAVRLNFEKLSHLSFTF